MNLIVPAHGFVINGFIVQSFGSATKTCNNSVQRTTGDSQRRRRGFGRSALVVFVSLFLAANEVAASSSSFSIDSRILPQQPPSKRRRHPTKLTGYGSRRRPQPSPRSSSFSSVSSPYVLNNENGSFKMSTDTSAEHRPSFFDFSTTTISEDFPEDRVVPTDDDDLDDGRKRLMLIPCGFMSENYNKGEASDGWAVLEHGGTTSHGWKRAVRLLEPTQQPPPTPWQTSIDKHYHEDCNHKNELFDNVQPLTSDSGYFQSSSLPWQQPNTNHVQDTIRVEGLLGVYHLPSGQLWVWIAHSVPVYNASTTSATTTSSNLPSCWWQIRKVDRLHLMHIPYSNRRPDPSNNDDSQFGATIMGRRNIAASRAQLQEELRQLSLLRQALKDHDWYFCDSSSNSNNAVVPDMTRNLQRCFVLWNQQQQARGTNATNAATNSSSLASANNISSGNSWWKSPQTTKSDLRSSASDTKDDDADHNQSSLYPDSRFFWNEDILKPILQYHRHHVKARARPSDPVGATHRQQASSWLLDWSIPVTSAFVGVQRNIYLFHQRDDKNNNIDGEAARHLCSYDQVLISRRSKWRAGTRFTKRGADATGNVANYAETEQVVVIQTPYEHDHDDKSINNMTTTATSTAMNRTSNSSHNPDSLRSKSCQTVCSHVQVRGSIPLHWSSPTDIKTYRPKVRIGTDPLAQARALRQHLLDQISRYIIVNDQGNAGACSEDIEAVKINGGVAVKINGGVGNVLPADGKTAATASSTTAQPRNHPGLLLLNLVDKKDDQGRLGRAMDSVLQAVLDVYQTRQLYDTESIGDSTTISAVEDNHHHLNSNMIHHEWFDFHAQVKGGHWDDRLQSLLQDLKPILDEQSYFRASYHASRNNAYNNDDSSGNWQIERLQNGVIRTNCMDCLDRTNVVQGLFARHMLLEQLWAANMEPTSLAVQNAHRWLWADNADAISRLYAGTPALKGDYTRTGQRTRKGALDDGMNSVQRYYQNNFLDADRQEGIDLMLCNQDFTPRYTEEEDMIMGEDEDDERNPMGVLQDAARSLLMGASPWASLSPGSQAHKRRGGANGNPFPFFPNGGAFQQRQTSTSDRATPSLNFVWLPGDLRSHMQSLAETIHGNEHNTKQYDLLRAMDHRAARDLPWWVGASSSDDDEDTTDYNQSGLKNQDNNPSAAAATVLPTTNRLITEAMDSSMVNSILSALLAATFILDSSRGPLILAAAVLGITSLALSTFWFDHNPEPVNKATGKHPE
ncbi:hypothetical protein ACA910_015987 [Epithemia clementina (nom. ined.)]